MLHILAARHNKTGEKGQSGTILSICRLPV